MQASQDLTAASGTRLIFVGGAPRSGTTLVQNMLDSHPEIAGGPEFDLVEKIVELRNLLQLKVANRRIDSFLGSRDADRAVAAFLESMLFPYAEKKGRRLLSEKTPANVLVFRELLEIFPGAKFIFCVRDPRAVVSSLMTVRKKAMRRNDRFSVALFTRRFWRAAWYSRICMESGFFALRDHPDRIMLVKYEELVSAPRDATRKISRFLGVGWDERMVEPDKVKHDGEVGIDGIWYDEKQFYSKPDTGRIDKWRHELSWYQRLRLELYFGKYAVSSELGYVMPKHPAVFSLSLTGSYWDYLLRLASGLCRRIANHL